MGRKWANIVAKKTAKDGANSKVYAKFGVEIYVAAKKRRARSRIELSFEICY